MDKHFKVKLLIDYLHRFAFHHVLWFLEVEHQLGIDEAYKLLDNVYEKSYEVFINRLSKSLNIKLEDNLPQNLLNMDDKNLDTLLQSIALNWLANDGIWFQSIEFTKDMNDAKRCNDSCWSRFSPFEAHSIKKLLKLGKNSGLTGLEKALNFRIYTLINKQTIKRDNNSLILEVNDCRVQSTRKRKLLDEYPCKSAGIVEFSRFASTIDESIKTEVVACPPDKHPETFFCAWKFLMGDKLS